MGVVHWAYPSKNWKERKITKNKNLKTRKDMDFNFLQRAKLLIYDFISALLEIIKLLINTVLKAVDAKKTKHSSRSVKID